LDVVVVADNVYFFGVKIQDDFDAVEKIQTFLLLEDVGYKPQGIQLNDRQIHLAGAQTLNVFNRAPSRHHLNINILFRRHILDILRDLKILPSLGPVAMVNPKPSRRTSKKSVPGFFFDVASLFSYSDLQASQAVLRPLPGTR